MISKVNLKLGGVSYQFEFEDKDDIQAMHKAIAVSQIRKVCNVCQSHEDKFGLVTNKSKGFTFINVKCNHCGGKSGLGQYKDGGYYWKEFEAFEKRPTTSNMSADDIAQSLK
jgi:hypothetical protein